MLHSVGDRTLPCGQTLDALPPTLMPPHSVERRLHTLNQVHKPFPYAALQRLPTYHFRESIAKGTFYIQESARYIASFLQLPVYSIYSLMQCRVDRAALLEGVLPTVKWPSCNSTG